MEQFELNFEAGLTDQFPAFGDVVRAAVYSGRKALKSVAADLDLSSSMLSRMLNEADQTVNFPAHRIGELIDATGDLRPIYWLVEKYCSDADGRRKQAAAQLEALLPKIASALKAMGQ